MIRLLAPLILIAALCSPAAAHPAGGIVVDARGNVYFTYVHPMTGPDHHACVWRIDSMGRAAKVFKSSHDPSDIHLAVSPDGRIHGLERRYLGEINGKDVYESRLWRLQDTGDATMVVPPTRDKSELWNDGFAVGDGGVIYFGSGKEIRRRQADGVVDVFAKGFGRINAIVCGPKSDAKRTLIVLDRDSLRKVAADGTVTTIANGLRQDKPAGLPFKGGNILFDLDIDDAGNAYIAYFGDRRVMRVDAAGKVSTILRSQNPWTPHGITWNDGTLHVLESTMPGDTITPRIRTWTKAGEVETLFGVDSGGDSGGD